MRQIPPKNRPPFEGGQNRFSKNTGSRGHTGGYAGGHTGGGGNVLDSMGPEGKIRGTARQIVDRYLTLARDALAVGDHVGAEGFFQHAEHYLRLLSESSPQQASFSGQKRYPHEKRVSDGESVPPAALVPPLVLTTEQLPVEEPAVPPPLSALPKPEKRPRVYRKPKPPVLES